MQQLSLKDFNALMEQIVNEKELNEIFGVFFNKPNQKSYKELVDEKEKNRKKTEADKKKDLLWKQVKDKLSAGKILTPAEKALLSKSTADMNHGQSKGAELAWANSLK